MDPIINRHRNRLMYELQWLYIGTDRGNIHLVNLDTFLLNDYVINWNKAIELSCRSHPGRIVALGECPIDSTQLLIGYETGTCILWNLLTRQGTSRIFSSTDILTDLSSFQAKNS